MVPDSWMAGLSKLKVVGKPEGDGVLFRVEICRLKTAHKTGRGNTATNGT